MQDHESRRIIESLYEPNDSCRSFDVVDQNKNKTNDSQENYRHHNDPHLDFTKGNVCKCIRVMTLIS